MSKDKKYAVCTTSIARSVARRMKIRIGSKKSRQRSKWNKSEKKKYDSCLEKIDESLLTEGVSVSQEDNKIIKKEAAKYGYLTEPDQDFIGAGMFGAVFVAVNPDKPPGKFAVKAIHKERSESAYSNKSSSLEGEISRYKFFNTLEDEDISKHFPKVYEIINNEEDTYVYIIMELLRKNKYDEDLINFLKPEGTVGSGKDFQMKRIKIMNKSGNLLRQSFLRYAKRTGPKKNYIIHKIVEYMANSGAFMKIGNHVSNMDFKEPDEERFKGKIDLQNYSNKILKNVLNFKLEGEGVHKRKYEHSEDIFLDDVIEMATKSGQAAWINYYHGIIETYNMWIDMNIDKIMNAIVGFDLQEIGDNWEDYYTKSLEGKLYWVYDNNDNKYISKVAIPWEGVSKYVFRSREGNISKLIIAEDNPDLTKLKWNHMHDLEYFIVRANVRKVCNDSTAKFDLCSAFLREELMRDVPEILGMILNETLLNLNLYLDKTYIPTMGKMRDISDADADLSPQAKSFVNAVNKLRDKYGIIAGDMHHGNLMARPSTGDIVVPDVGLFRKEKVSKKSDLPPLPPPPDPINERKRKIIIEIKRKRRKNVSSRRS